ncbi:acetyl-CoA C-acyltransferase [Psychrobacter sp. Sarcosine-02u-2]|nr:MULTISPECIES: acetyl-CoA C-acetyltransferase [Psychrobacter]OAP67614.1 acetyl-CoA acetyltransferase [Psychrobacter sp. SHUES1]PKG86752.1 acetyl-CoA C-acyltransferase [Psychrobacter sp. Sarcosine-02u-2]HCR87839.1 acetyl-CoA C-acetyltransferase [Psychrobacter sp.]
MSTKNNHPDSPVVETTVVKAGDSQNTETATDAATKKAATEDAKHPNVFDTMANSKTAEPKQADDKKLDAKTADTKTDSSNKDNSKKDESKKDDSKKESTAEKSSKDSKTTNATKDDSAAKDANKKTDTASTKTTATTAKESSKTGLSSGQHRVAILGGNRIPFARSNGTYADVSNTDMLTAALDGLVERFNLQDEKVGEVVAGAVMKLSRDINLTREATLSTALNPHTPTYDISQACGTGLQATFASANKIALGIIDSAITGGVDTTSDAPIAVGDGLRKVLIKLGAAKDNKQRLKALMGLNPKDLIDSPQNGEPRTGLSMGDHQAITTLEWNISREDQDELAFNSHKNLARAYDEGFFDDLITPYKGLTRDNNLRPDTTLDKLAKLKPVFGKKNANPTMTAANSTPLTDGASCVLLANDEWAKERGFKPLAYIVHQETAAVDFIGKSGDKEGLLMAPAYAVPRMLERAGLTLQDFDFYEIHEAFASQVLSTLAAWEDEKFCQERLGLDAPLGSIDRSKLNVNGSSLAAGHPFAATGGRILATAAKLLDQKGSGRALISICAAGGQGVTCILEK